MIELSEPTFIIISRVNLLLSGKLLAIPTLPTFELYVVNCVCLFEFCTRLLGLDNLFQLEYLLFVIAV